MSEPKQKAELRVVIRQEEKYGLFWQATMNGQDIYAGPPDNAQAWSRVSHHASGQGHLHVYRGEARIKAPPSPPPGELVGAEKIGGWSHADIKWDYKAKSDSEHRKTLVIDGPSTPLGVDLWILQANRQELAAEVLHQYRQNRILGTLHFDKTNPQVFAVAYTMTAKALESFRQAVERQQTPANR